MKKIDYEVYDNIISIEQSTEILKVLQSPQFPWFLSAGFYTASKEDIESKSKKFKNLKEYLQFVHTFYSYSNVNFNTEVNSAYVKLVNDIINAYMNREKIDTLKIIRCKANFQTQHSNNNSSLHNTPHKDFYIPHTVMLYYANDSDGDTILFDKDEKEYARISPKKGRILVFNGNYLHAGSHPFKSECRIVINYDLEVDDKS
jgi:hypothetical protein